MRHASLRNLKAIYRHFRKRKDVFPHIRQDRLRQRIEAHHCIWQDGVVITYQQYKKGTSVGDVQVPAGAIMLHPIFNTNPFSGAGRRIFRRFVDEIVKPSGGDLYLSVRKQNGIACQFYERNGMKVEGTVAWKNRTVPGLVYKLAKS
jgi:hypothetical protein